MLPAIAAGSANTIATKLQDETVVGFDSNNQPMKFHHPVVQSACMFLGCVPFGHRTCFSLPLAWYARPAPPCNPLAPEEAGQPSFPPTRSEALCLVPHLLGVLVAHVRSRANREPAYEALPESEAAATAAESGAASGGDSSAQQTTNKQKLLRLAVFGLPARARRKR